MPRRRTRSIVSERRDIFDASNNSQSHPDDVQQQSVNKSQKGKGKEPERDHTPPLRAQNEQYSRSAPPRLSVPMDAVKPQQMAEFHTSGNTALNTAPVQSDPERAIIATASQAPAVYFARNDIESMASTSRNRPSRPPRTLLESVHAHLGRNTASRTSKRHAGAGESEATPQYTHHDTCDGGNNVPAFHSRFSSPPTNALPTSPSAHFLNFPPRSDVTTPVGEENTSAKGNHTRGRVRSLPADHKSPDEDISFEIMLARPTSEDQDRSKDEHNSASSPPPITDPEGSAPRSRQKPKANPNPILSPHNTNPIHWNEVAEHIQRDHQEAATYTNEAAAPSPPTRTRSSDMRAVLLRRLREEQRAMKSDECSTLHSASTMTVPMSGATNHRDEETEAEALETRLRTRALLRVRLAAIKTAANQSLIES